MATTTFIPSMLRGAGTRGVPLIPAGNVSQDEFIMRVDTTIAGATPSNQFQIKTTGGPYNYDVDWGDGQTDTGVTSATGITHTYATGGEYDIKISGTFPIIRYNNNTEGDKIIEIKNWGIIQWTSFFNSFKGCGNLDLTATDYPDLTNCTSLYGMFFNCSSLENTNGSIGSWDTSTITNIFGMFKNCSLFNQSINNWDVSNVTSFGSNALGMFDGCTSFNQPLNNWDVSNSTSFVQMFRGCTAFNQDLSNWDVSKATSLSGMFQNATSFNNGGQSGISNWNVEKVTSMFRLFRAAASFNQNLSSWSLNTSSFSASEVFLSAGMSTANYTDTIVGWANYVNTNSAPFTVTMTSQNGQTFDRSRSGGANFSDAGAARDYLTGATANWTISSDTEIN